MFTGTGTIRSFGLMVSLALVIGLLLAAPIVPVATAKDPLPASIDELKRAAETGDTNAMAWLGRAYQRGYGGVSPDSVKARQYFKRAADRGSADAAHQLAYFMENGIGGSRNLKAAFKAYEKAANMGSVSSRAQMGRMYHDAGNRCLANRNYAGAAWNFRHAWAHYRKAAEKGNQIAQKGLQALEQIRRRDFRRSDSSGGFEYEPALGGNAPTAPTGPPFR